MENTFEQCDALVSFEKVHKFKAYLVQTQVGRKIIRLNVGCRSFASSKQAKAHWKGGKNRSGDPRPNAAELIALAVATAKKLKLNWK